MAAPFKVLRSRVVHTWDRRFEFRPAHGSLSASDCVVTAVAFFP